MTEQSDITGLVRECRARLNSAAISDNARRWRDTTHAKNVIGWQPTGSSDNFDPKALSA